MRVLLAFVIGWAAGAKAGPERLDEVLSSFNEVRESQEVGALVAMVRSHVASVLREVADAVTDRPVPAQVEGVLERVQRMVAKGPTSPAS